MILHPEIARDLESICPICGEREDICLSVHFADELAELYSPENIKGLIAGIE